MYIKIRNKEIREPIINILKVAQKELTNGKLKEIKSGNSGNCVINCPIHKEGKENRPSCMILTDTTCKDLEAGFAHCFTCGYNAPFSQVIGDLFDEDRNFGEEWLLERFGNVFVETQELLPEIVVDKQIKSIKSVDESILDQYDFYHPYMWQRHLTKEVVDKFRIGYDKIRNAITFPVYDEKHRLVMITARCVDNKRFYIPSGIEKPIYLLYYLLENNIDRAIITEGQIDALTAWTYGVPAVATMGCPSSNQIDLLNKSGLRTLIVMFDNDEAGSNFTRRIKNLVNKDILLLYAHLPEGKKDINDLTKEEFDYVMQHLT